MTFDRSAFVERFKSETKERVEKLNLALIDIEKDPGNRDILNMAMREAHTIKGSAAMMGYNRISDLAHRLETAMQGALQGKMEFTPEKLDVMFECLDAILPLLEDKVTWEDKGVANPFVETLLNKMDGVFSENSPAQDKSERPLNPGIPPLRTEEKKAKEAPAPEPGPLEQPSRDDHLPETMIKVDTARLNKIVNTSGELVTSRIRLAEIVKLVSEKVYESQDTGIYLKGLIDELNSVTCDIVTLTAGMQEEVIRVRTVPVGDLFRTFPRTMRDLAREKGKEIEFVIEGGETQLDKVIIDEMRAPLMHLLRNAIDHGIEAPGDRRRVGKSAPGKVRLKAYQEGSQVVIEVSDDGRGIKVAEIKEKAVKKGIVSASRINDMIKEQVYQILFTPGFSTKEDVTDISGRGVGLDVVRETLSSMKGVVEISSEEGKGTSFKMKLPLTLAITECLILGAGPDVFAVPIDAVVETVRISEKEIKKIEGKEALTIRGYILPLVKLKDVFGLPQKGIFEKQYFPVIIVQSIEKRIGIMADKLFGRQEIISKSIGDPLGNVKYVSGATILGNGRVILILDIPAMIESAEGVVVRRPLKKEAPAARKRKKHILLAEDSMTTAMLEKNILESVGYSVVTAKDGQEAAERAMQEKFDLVITDVLMPRMNGFELIERLRGDSKYKDVPVIVVTTRENDEDRRRGLEAGADAYLLKSEFTSEGLLDTLEKLLG
ncbi:MAG: hybrid sensor histidine kinase/response regulator [Candidatus Omnitrophica bacterium]|nr:hybrid sensor histidine kinase/response regulator [Candidatus Omnitrophota bacterium]